MKDILTSPDEPGWYWFRISLMDEPRVVLVNDDGIGRFLDSDGLVEELDETKGYWEPIEYDEM